MVDINFGRELNQNVILYIASLYWQFSSVQLARCYSPCAQICVRTHNSNGKNIKFLRQIVPAFLGLRYRGDVNSVSTASI